MVGEWGFGLQLLGTRLQAVAPLQHGFLGQANFPRQLRAGLPLQHAAHEQHDVHWSQLTAREDGAAVEVIDALAVVTAPDGQATPTINAKEAGVGARRLAVRARLATGMKMLLQPGDALVVIEEVYDRKVHAVDRTRFALLV